MLVAEPAADQLDDDVELMLQIAAGDAGAPMAELFHRYAGRLYGFGVRRLGDTGLADELVQETFVRVWRTADQYDPARGSVATFLFTLARRIAVDLWRRPSSRSFEPPVEQETAMGDPSDELVRAWALREAMESLSHAHREVLELSYGETGLSQREIADTLGLPLGTVKTRSYYALRSLKLALEERGWHD